MSARQLNKSGTTKGTATMLCTGTMSAENPERGCHECHWSRASCPATCTSERGTVMRLFVVFALALPLSAIAAPAPVDKLDERQEPGPSGRVVSPDEYSTFTAPSGIIDFSYEMVTTL